MSLSRNYVFICNNYTIADECQCFALSYEKHVIYFVVGKEVGECGTPHLQGFICFSAPKSLAQMKELFPTAHFESKRGTFLQASDYCKKEGDYYEWGELPSDPVVKGMKGKEAYEAMMKEGLVAVREGRITDVPLALTSQLKAIQYRVLMEEQQLRQVTDIDGDLEHEWYYGPPGTGKSKKAREENPDAYLKMCNKWWDGYRNEDVVIIEDFDKDHKVLVHHLKIWADRYKFPAEVKGGKIDIRPRKIIVTSNYHPRDIWEDEKDLAPIKRRFKIIHFLDPFAKYA